ncbi:hypothetical protein JCGZ_19940 [Jatropha curcas]|uniref:Protein RIK n=1 Tax=Jatropha curcas TaxID=180498 RepID=A0A067JTH5_JATCU|nr:hypothetical protein JCGZ_19940 [Jatropha curcas]
MTEESGTRVSSDNPTANTDASQSRQRKRRKWDQPAESLVSAGLSGVVPLGNIGTLAGISLPGLASVSGAYLTNQLVASCATVPPVFQVPSAPLNNGVVVSRPNQPKIQDELIIAREIVINDAESSVRYKLTKRQTQEEIQKCTGAVVITRGKYRPLNTPPDGEKPLYLHISSGAHLKDTAERILAVDRAAAMIEEMLKQSPNLQSAPSIFPIAGGSGLKALSTCVFLGFDADSSLNIAARIRGPNDQYINHIMNETGATVVLKGRGSGNLENPNTGEAQQPLHLFLSASNPKSLEDAKRLAENLLDTISLECGASRVSSSKVYNAVPPPQQLLAGVQNSGNENKLNAIPPAGLALSAMSSTPPIPATSVKLHVTNSQGTVYQPGGLINSGQPQPNLLGQPQPSVSGGTSYSGYGGIYPQATPLQQVALALRQSTSPITSTVAPTSSVALTTLVASTAPTPSTSTTLGKEKRPTQKRKFQELPIGLKDPAKCHQGSELLKSGEEASADGVRNISTMPAPKKLIQPSQNGIPLHPPKSMPPPPPGTKSSLPSSKGMPPPPPRTMPPPPPPPKFNSSNAADKLLQNNVSNKSKSDTVPVVSDTLVKLMEYGEEDDDPEETNEESDHSNILHGNSHAVAVRKPFWAL